MNRGPNSQPNNVNKPGDDVAPGSQQSGENLCRRCDGSGQLTEGPCAECGGTGKVTVLIGDA